MGNYVTTHSNKMYNDVTFTKTYVSNCQTTASVKYTLPAGTSMQFKDGPLCKFRIEDVYDADGYKFSSLKDDCDHDEVNEFKFKDEEGHLVYTCKSY